MTPIDEAKHRRQLLADSVYLEGRSHALIMHSQELIAKAQQMRARHEQMFARTAALSSRRGPWPGAVRPPKQV